MVSQRSDGYPENRMACKQILIKHFKRFWCPGANSNAVSISRKVIPADNSCLFNSFCFAYSHTGENLFTHQQLRDLIVSTVAAKRSKYPPEVLGSDVTEYQKFIRNPQSWGGAIEAAILADHFEMEVRIGKL